MLVAECDNYDVIELEWSGLDERHTSVSLFLHPSDLDLLSYKTTMASSRKLESASEKLRARQIGWDVSWSGVISPQMAERGQS